MKLINLLSNAKPCILRWWIFRIVEFYFKITSQIICLSLRFTIKTKYFNTRLSPMFLYSAKKAIASKATTHILKFDINFKKLLGDFMTWF